VPIPANVVDLVQTTWRKELTSDGKAVWPVK
jgi:hypothetical protein